MCLQRNSVSWTKNSSVALVSGHLRKRKTKEDPPSIIPVASYTLVTRRSSIPKKKILWRTVAWKCSVMKAFLNFLQNTQEKASVRVYLKKSWRSSAGNFIKKENLAQAFSSEFCKIIKSTFFTEQFWRSPSGRGLYLIKNVPKKTLLIIFKMLIPKRGWYFTLFEINYKPRL